MAKTQNGLRPTGLAAIGMGIVLWGLVLQNTKTLIAGVPLYQVQLGVGSLTFFLGILFEVVSLLSRIRRLRDLPPKTNQEPKA